MKFLGAKEDYSKADIVLFGVPFDGTSSYRFGSHKAPDVIRGVSDSIETYSPYFQKDLDDLMFVDKGNISMDSDKDPVKMIQIVRNYCKKLIDDDKVPFALGGEHTITYPIIQALLEKFNNITLIHLDAHTDLRDEYEGEKFSHACVMRRLLDLKGVEIIQIGIRSGTKQEFEFMHQHKTLCQIDEFGSIQNAVKNKNVYLTVDIDVFDPSLIPGTGNPEPGGILFPQFIAFLKHLQQVNFIGMDIMELNPQIDQTETSSIITAEIVRELLLSIKK